ncbi:MAG TPA: PQQ-binding-like beta-propeller repeat protein [Tepidisphaeraceae bacterium]|nr:PQQ-binding-like beta-propeller repeat protein [Tepidisphaeraceae bacterium]
MKPFFRVLAVFALVSPALAADWPQYRGPNHDGLSPETNINKSWPAGGPKVLWKIPVGESFGSIAVVGKHAYLMVERNGNELCICLDADTGKEIWQRPLDKTIFENQGGNGPRTTPTIDGERVYVLGTYLKLACLSPSDGQVLWSHDLMKEFNGQISNSIKKWGNAASPIVDGNSVFVAGGGPGESILAFNKLTGALLWKGENEKITHASPVPATFSGVHQIVFLLESGLLSKSADTGQLLWRYKFPFNVSTAASPVIAGDIIFCSAGYGVGGAAVRISKNGDQFSAAEIWRIPGDDAVANHWSTPVHYNGYLYGLYGFRKSYSLKCIDIKDGKEMWKGPEFGSGGLIVVDGMVLVQGARGDLVLAEAKPDAYKELARAQPLVGKSWTMATLSNGRIYARSSTHAICLDVSGK